MSIIENIKIMLNDRLSNQFDILFSDKEISSIKIKYEENILNIYDEAKGKHVKEYFL
jgi:hypothetical protein